MHRLILRAAFVAVIFCMTAFAAQAVENVSDRDKFKLWNECKGVSLLVEGLSGKAQEIGLTKNAIEVTARSRLRAARIFNESSAEWLYVNVNVFGSAFRISVQFSKYLKDMRYGASGSAITWDIGSVGTHGNDANFIIGSVSQKVDRFIDEYLRFNAEACK